MPATKEERRSPITERRFVTRRGNVVGEVLQAQRQEMLLDRTAGPYNKYTVYCLAQLGNPFHHRQYSKGTCRDGDQVANVVSACSVDFGATNF